ncbi:MAG: protein-L-isoaspartate(D-aspartate) O-methyltransferase [Thermosynechococcaceae cyanobacterium]
MVWRILTIMLVLVLLSWFQGGPVWAMTLQPEVDAFSHLRSQMVTTQLQNRGINDPAVLKAMATVPRHHFVLDGYQNLAYADRPLPIGYDQTISQPYIVAYMVASLDIHPNKRVLEVGTGSGYQAAILGQLAKAVYTIEIVSALAKRAQQTLQALGYENIHVKTGDGSIGWASHAPYDAIIVAAAPEHLPEALVDQLALNGRLVIPIGKQNQMLVMLQKTPNGMRKVNTIPVRFVPMTGEVVQ